MNAGSDPGFPLIAMGVAPGPGSTGGAPADLPVAIGFCRSMTEGPDRGPVRGSSSFLHVTCENMETLRVYMWAEKA
ncbi:hypothetical protein GCM10009625_39110 [Brachybacterium fresconis]